MCLLEGAEASRAMASGMAAVTASLLCELKAGDHVVSSRALFGSCQYVIADFLPRFGVSSTLVDGRDLDAWRKAVRPETRAFFLESPSNPTLELIDIAAVAEIANEAGARLIVDNVFSTPLFQKPLELGAHIVVYSATKHIDGQGRCLGGIVLSDEEWVEEKLFPYLKHTGPSLSPFNAWVLLKALETLEIRVTRQAESAAKLAEMLADHPVGRAALLSRPRKPPAVRAGAAADERRRGTMISFEVRGGKRAAFDFLPRAGRHQDLQQPRRRQEPRHASGDDDASAAEGGGAGSARHRRRADPAFGRPGGPRRSRRRSSERARPRRGPPRPRRVALKLGCCWRVHAFLSPVGPVAKFAGCDSLGMDFGESGRWR